MMNKGSPEQTGIKMNERQAVVAVDTLLGFSRRCFILGVILIYISLKAVDGHAAPEKVQRFQDSRNHRAINALIDSLASHNQQPSLVGVSTRLAPGTNPLYSKQYDWNEDARVKMLVAILGQHEGEDFFWCLME